MATGHLLLPSVGSLRTGRAGYVHLELKKTFTEIIPLGLRPRHVSAKRRGRAVAYTALGTEDNVLRGTQEQEEQVVYLFGAGCSGSDGSMTQLLGTKGANLAEMSRLDLPVPPGLTLTTKQCAAYHESGGHLLQEQQAELAQALKRVEKMAGKTFGDHRNPLLLSVRCGAEVTVPGLMNTVLNLGMNDSIVESLAAQAGQHFAWDSYHRFITMFGEEVLRIDPRRFAGALEDVRAVQSTQQHDALTTRQLMSLVRGCKAVYTDCGHTFPESPHEQLRMTIAAGFSSWESEGPVLYRSVHNRTQLLGAAVTVQAMVFGNLGEKSATGLCFTRNPSNGTPELFGRVLVRGQGEDVATSRSANRSTLSLSQLQAWIPEVHLQLKRSCAVLERAFCDMQAIEFTIQEGRLFMLQCRGGKRTGQAALKIAEDMVDAGVMSIPKAITSLDASHLDQLIHPQFSHPDSLVDDVIGYGIAASPGAAVGQAVFDSEAAQAASDAGYPVILLLKSSGPSDAQGMYAAEAVVTTRGDNMSHAATTMRSWGKPCACNCTRLKIDLDAKCAVINGITIREGDSIAVNGSTGEIILGAPDLQAPTLTPDIMRFMGWVDQYRGLDVLANADTVEAATQAIQNGADGLGLVCTEQMILSTPDQVQIAQQMVYALTPESRTLALAAMTNQQRKELFSIFQETLGLPVTVRLLSPPLRDNSPPGSSNEGSSSDSSDSDTEMSTVQMSNPLLGFRGRRLEEAYPEIAEFQARAIMEAACEAQRGGVVMDTRIVIPLVGRVDSLLEIAAIVRATADQVMTEQGQKVPLQIGAMIEVPRAALAAAEIAKGAEFFCVNTTELAQAAYGHVRDDVGRFLPLQESAPANDIFHLEDRHGVCQLIQTAVTLGRETRPELKITICGDRAGDMTSASFAQSLGFDGVSCSAFRVRVALLYSAHAVIRSEGLA